MVGLGGCTEGREVGDGDGLAVLLFLCSYCLAVVWRGKGTGKGGGLNDCHAIERYFHNVIPILLVLTRQNCFHPFPLPVRQGVVWTL